MSTIALDCFWTGDQEVIKESPPNEGDQICATKSDHSPEVEASSTPPDQLDGETPKAPPLLRDLDQDLLQSGKLLLTGRLHPQYVH